MEAIGFLPEADIFERPKSFACAHAVIDRAVLVNMHHGIFLCEGSAQGRQIILDLKGRIAFFYGRQSGICSRIEAHTQKKLLYRCSLSRFEAQAIATVRVSRSIAAQC